MFELTCYLIIIYQLVEVLAIVSLLSTVMTGKFFQEMVLQTAQLKATVCLGYVDDIFKLWKLYTYC